MIQSEKIILLSLGLILVSCTNKQKQMAETTCFKQIVLRAYDKAYEMKQEHLHGKADEPKIVVFDEATDAQMDSLVHAMNKKLDDPNLTAEESNELAQKNFVALLNFFKKAKPGFMEVCTDTMLTMIRKCGSISDPKLKNQCDQSFAEKVEELQRLTLLESSTKAVAVYLDRQKESSVE